VPGSQWVTWLNAPPVEDRCVLVEIIKKHDELREPLGFDSKGSVDILKFNTVRNAVAHLNNLLIRSKDDIKKIYDDCDKIIEYSKKISRILDSNPPPADSSVAHKE